MSKYGDELEKFSVNGKTFFINKLQSKNGDPYIGVNALFGNQQWQNLTIFNTHALPFIHKLNSAYKAVWGIGFLGEDKDRGDLCYFCRTPLEGNISLVQLQEVYFFKCKTCEHRFEVDYVDGQTWRYNDES